MSGQPRETLPPFTVEGVLPPLDYELTLDQLHESLLVEGASYLSPDWDKQWRAALVSNLEVLAQQLWQVGITSIYINGSFVEDKNHPNDIDGYFDCELRHLVSGRLEQELNALDPHQSWTWDPSDRRFDPDSGKAQLPMWFQYHVELYPNYGQLCGIRDQFGNPLTFPSAFRVSRRSHTPKGIIRLAR